MKPALITVALSVAAVGGYLIYRLVVHAPPDRAAAAQPAKGLVAQMPDFTLENLAGKPQSIKSLAGAPMLINFWATWCGPCREEIPMLKKLQDQNPWLKIVGVAVDEPDAVRKYAKTMQFNYPVLMGESGAMNAAASFGVDFYALPFTVFADSEGHMLGVHTGELHPEQVSNLLAVLQDLRSKRIDVAAARKRIAGRM